MIIQLPVFLFLETVLGNEKSTFSGELPGGSHGLRRAGVPLVAGATVIGPGSS